MIGEKLRDIRKKQRLTQEETARKIGVSIKTYKNWEAGSFPSLQGFYDICKTLHVSADCLLGLDKYRIIFNDDLPAEDHELLCALIQSDISVIGGTIALLFAPP